MNDKAGHIRVRSLAPLAAPAIEREITSIKDMHTDMTPFAPQSLTVRNRASRVALVAAALAALAACSSGNERPNADLAAAQVNTIGVNSYLWRATLDTVSFAPLLQADSAGGVVVTDWYANPSNPEERVKMTIAILDTDLRADALRVAASRQVSQGGTWVEAPVQAATVQKLEDIILTKARQLRRQAVTN